FAAVAIGLLGGFGVMALTGVGRFDAPLREGVGNGGCGASSIRTPKPVVWRFWEQPDRRRTFGRNAAENTLFLGKWLAIAFFLESLMLAYVPAETVTQWLGGAGWSTVLAATAVGVPAYLNGYAALPLVSGLIDQGMTPGAGMAFLLAGGVSSIPAAIAVWALARPPVFAAYLGFAFLGAFALGLGYGLVA
ncbi:MAG: permease, partial [Alphaproteobacteria bacterium]